MTPYPAPAPIPSQELTALVGSKWCETHQTLVVALDKKHLNPKEAMHKIWAICPDYNLVIVDDFVDVNNLSDVAWRALGNTDWRRDLEISRDTIDHYASGDLPRSFIGLDATSKTAEDGHPRGWPEEIFMTDDIVKKVDERWSAYGLQ